MTRVVLAGILGGLLLLPPAASLAEAAGPAPPAQQKPRHRSRTTVSRAHARSRQTDCRVRAASDKDKPRTSFPRRPLASRSSWRFRADCAPDRRAGGGSTCTFNGLNRIRLAVVESVAHLDANEPLTRERSRTRGAAHRIDPRRVETRASSTCRRTTARRRSTWTSPNDRASRAGSPAGPPSAAAARCRTRRGSTSPTSRATARCGRWATAGRGRVSA